MDEPWVQPELPEIKMADISEPQAPSVKTPVKDPNHLTDAEKAIIIERIKKDNFNTGDVAKDLPDGTTISISDNGTATITYPDGSTDTIPAVDTIIIMPSDKVSVVDPSHLTDAEKAQVADKIRTANPSLPSEAQITVANDGTATVTYPDGSTATISGRDLVVQKAKTPSMADQITPNLPVKTPVADLHNLTPEEKAQVQAQVERANPDLPVGTVITVANDGTVTITYPDGSTDTIAAKDTVVQAQTDQATIVPATQARTQQPVAAKVAKPQASQAQLPHTGDDSSTSATALGLVAAASALGLIAKRKRQDEEEE